ncbi:hypothetical protein [Burkholderia orbicola]|uniref:hypothetical protein n=1 Tax=Burkholderia orbicola TaxID=2978683 RepID=UPI00265A1C03|nr:hypothetical protein [Burkholderia orbicola]
MLDLDLRRRITFRTEQQIVAVTLYLHATQGPARLRVDENVACVRHRFDCDYRA